MCIILCFSLLFRKRVSYSNTEASVGDPLLSVVVCRLSSLSVNNSTTMCVDEELSAIFEARSMILGTTITQHLQLMVEKEFVI